MKVSKVKSWIFILIEKIIKIKEPWDYWFLLVTNSYKPNPKSKSYVGPIF